MQTKNINLFPNEVIKVDGIRVEYGLLPRELIYTHKGTVFYFRTTDAYETELHESIVRKLLKQLESESYNHGVYWNLSKVEALIWKYTCQITVASFRLRDSY